MWLPVNDRNLMRFTFQLHPRSQQLQLCRNERSSPYCLTEETDWSELADPNEQTKLDNGTALDKWSSRRFLLRRYYTHTTLEDEG